MAGDELTESVRAWVAGWSDEVAAADIRAGRERFADDLVAFGTHADVVVGREAVEAQQWSQIWPKIDTFAFLVDELTVQASPDGLLAVAIVPWTSVGVAEDGSQFDRPGRATVVLTRTDAGARWLGTHTHFSLARGVPQSTHGGRTAIR